MILIRDQKNEMKKVNGLKKVSENNYKNMMLCT